MRSLPNMHRLMSGRIFLCLSLLWMLTDCALASTTPSGVQTDSTTNEPATMSTTTQRPTQRTTTLGPGQSYCYRCDSRDGGDISAICLTDWGTLNFNQTLPLRVICNYGYCVKYDYTVRNKTKGHKKPKDRIQVIVRDCATEDEVDSLPTHINRLYRKTTRCQMGKLFDDQKVKRCICPDNYCNHGNSNLATNATLLGLLVAMVMLT